MSNVTLREGLREYEIEHYMFIVVTVMHMKMYKWFEKLT